MMSFKSFTWPHNPKNIEISMFSNSKTYYLPGLGPYIQSLGENYRIVTGCGEFFGPDAIANFEELSSISRENSVGKLFIPPITSMSAYLTEFSITAKSAPDLISYKFKFIESVTKSSDCPIDCKNNSYTLSDNENLWNVSHKFKISIEQLLRNNPSIPDPYSTIPGQRISIT